jgi:hypothetical protein
LHHDLGDIDGDGELDAIDIVVLEESERFLPASKPEYRVLFGACDRQLTLAEQYSPLVISSLDQ